MQDVTFIRITLMVKNDFFYVKPTVPNVIHRRKMWISILSILLGREKYLKIFPICFFLWWHELQMALITSLRLYYCFSLVGTAVTGAFHVLPDIYVQLMCFYSCAEGGQHYSHRLIATVHDNTWIWTLQRKIAPLGEIFTILKCFQTTTSRECVLNVYKSIYFTLTGVIQWKRCIRCYGNLILNFILIYIYIHMIAFYSFWLFLFIVFLYSKKIVVSIVRDKVLSAGH